MKDKPMIDDEVIEIAARGYIIRNDAYVDDAEKLLKHLKRFGISLRDKYEPLLSAQQAEIREMRELIKRKITSEFQRWDRLQGKMTSEQLHDNLLSYIDILSRTDTPKEVPPTSK